MSEWHQTYMIGGSWSWSGIPDYEVYRWRDTPKSPSLEWTNDDNWVKIKLPKENMKRFEVINYLHTLHPGCYHSFNGPVIDEIVTVTFRKLPESQEETSKRMPV